MSINGPTPVKTMSSLMKVRQDDGSFIPFFPYVTSNEVFIDIDNNIRLSEYLNEMSNTSTSRSVDSLESMFTLSPGDVKLNEAIRTIDENRYFIVIDLNNLNSPLGYLEILTVNRVRPAVEFITYNK